MTVSGGSKSRRKKQELSGTVYAVHLNLRGHMGKFCREFRLAAMAKLCPNEGVTYACGMLCKPWQEMNPGYVV